MKIVAGNWKMHKTKAEVSAFFSEMKSFEINESARCIVCPSPTLLEHTCQQAQDNAFDVYSQNCHWEDSGAYTGEVSPLQLKDLGVTGTLVGHSERRELFGDDDKSCLMRAQGARKHGLQVIYCVGEKLSERESGKTEEKLETQLEGLCSQFQGDQSIVVAYEPVWAIGTGVTASVEQVRDTHAWINSYLNSKGCFWPILYGGSVKPNNFKSLLEVPHVSGGLVGGASLEAKGFQDLVNCLTELGS